LKTLLAAIDASQKFKTPCFFSLDVSQQTAKHGAFAPSQMHTCQLKKAQEKKCKPMEKSNTQKQNKKTGKGSN